MKPTNVDITVGNTYRGAKVFWPIIFPKMAMSATYPNLYWASSNTIITKTAMGFHAFTKEYADWILPEYSNGYDNNGFMVMATGK